MTDATIDKPVLLCFDGSAGAAAAIASAGRLVGSLPAVVITVDEPLKRWDPWDPATVLDAPIGKLLSRTLDLEEIADTVAQHTLSHGISLARGAGFQATGRVGYGRAWKVICEAADEVDAAVIVLGARGLSPAQSALLGSVSSAVMSHTHRPTLVVHDAREHSS
jgi:nucleotide-binding universal stress UspA family protein